MFESFKPYILEAPALPIVIWAIGVSLAVAQLAELAEQDKLAPRYLIAAIVLAIGTLGGAVSLYGYLQRENDTALAAKILETQSPMNAAFWDAMHIPDAARRWHTHLIDAGLYVAIACFMFLLIQGAVIAGTAGGRAERASRSGPT